MAKSLISTWRILVIVCFMLSWLAPSTVAQGVKDQRVAGHRIIKVYDYKNTGVIMSGFGPIFQDRVGRYWLANIFNGVYLFDEEKNLWKAFTKEVGGSPSNYLKGIGQSSDNGLWFVPWEQSAGVTLFDGARWQKLRLDYKQPNLKRRVSALFPGRDGRLWFAIEHELICLDNQSWSAPLNLPELIEGWRPLPPEQEEQMMLNIMRRRERETQALVPEIRHKITGGMQDKEGYIWLRTYSGIVRFDERNGEWKKYPRDNTSMVDTIYEDRRNRIWFADRRGKLDIYDKQKGTWASYDIKDYLPPDDRKDEFLNLTSVYQDKAGRMMFATFKGLVVFDEGKNAWEVLTNKNSDLPDSAIYTILENRAGNICISTGKGIVVLEP